MFDSCSFIILFIAIINLEIFSCSSKSGTDIVVVAIEVLLIEETLIPDLNYKIENTKNIHYGDILVKFNEYVDVQNNNVPFINNEKNLSKFKSESYLLEFLLSL